MKHLIISIIVLLLLFFLVIGLGYYHKQEVNSYKSLLNQSVVKRDCPECPECPELECEPLFVPVEV